MDSGDTSELESFTNDCEVQDMSFTGKHLTWCNNYEILHDRLYNKLDRTLVNDKWIQAFPNASTFFGLDGISDHAYGLVSMGVQSSINPRPFKFRDAWITNPQFRHLVEETWQTEVHGHPMYRFVTRLKVLKGKIKKLHRDKYSDIEVRIQKAKEELIATQHQLLLGCLNCDLMEKEKALRQEYMELLSVEGQLLRQRSKVEWMEQGDPNTAYFHAYIKQKRAQSNISAIYTEDGQWLYEEEQIKVEILRYYVKQ